MSPNSKSAALGRPLAELFREPLTFDWARVRGGEELSADASLSPLRKNGGGREPVGVVGGLRERGEEKVLIGRGGGVRGCRDEAEEEEEDEEMTDALRLRSARVGGGNWACRAGSGDGEDTWRVSMRGGGVGGDAGAAGRQGRGWCSSWRRPNPGGHPGGAKVAARVRARGLSHIRLPQTLASAAPDRGRCLVAARARR
jgi:hypothetical protein